MVGFAVMGEKSMMTDITLRNLKRLVRLVETQTFARQSELLNPLATFAFRFNFEMPIRQFYFTNRMFKHNNINLHL